MTYWKRLDLLIDAFAQVRQHHEARLLIVGEGPGRVDAAEQIRRLGIDADAEAVGWVDDPLLFAAYAWAFVLPSDEEGFAQVLTEAMSVGCPVITTDAQGGGPRFVTENGKYGLLISRGDREQLADAMIRLLKPDLRAHYSRLGWRGSRSCRRKPVPRARRFPHWAARTARMTAHPSALIRWTPGGQNPRYCHDRRRSHHCPFWASR